MSDAIGTVLVIDDDPSVRNALGDLFASVGLRVAVFGSPLEFLRSALPDTPSCLVLDVRLPDEFHPKDVHELIEGLLGLTSKFIPYVLSFLVLGLR